MTNCKKNSNKFQQFEKFPQSLSNNENSDFENSLNFINNKHYEDTNDTAIKEHVHVDIFSETRSNFEHVKLSQVCNNIDKNKKSSSMTSETDNKMQGISIFSQLVLSPFI